MDDFREWLSDNLRYFMLGFGILAVVLILFFGVRFISSKFGNQKTTEPKQETQQETETPTPTQEAEETPATTAEPETTPAAGELELNAYPQVNTLIEKYYAALTGKDVQSLKELVDELVHTDITSTFKDLAENSRKTKPKAVHYDEVDLEQISLFDTVQDQDIIEELKNLDITMLTPMDAMNTLYRLQNKLKNRW